MGRSVNYLSNAEYVIYFSCSDEQHEENLAWSWEDFIDNLKYTIKGKLKSYYNCDKWDNNETSIFLENELCEIGISEYCGLYSLSIRAKEEDYCYGYNRETLGKHHAEQIRKTLEKCLFDCGAELLNRIGCFSNGEAIFEKV